MTKKTYKVRGRKLTMYSRRPKQSYWEEKLSKEHLKRWNDLTNYLLLYLLPLTFTLWTFGDLFTHPFIVIGLIFGWGIVSLLIFDYLKWRKRG